ncbi:toluene monooxygenase [Novosphingobium profundi]|nr:toluene monooxygenase [Novosphingobium profundi]
MPENPLDARFVRVRGRRPGGITEFDFAIGAPEIFVELIMPDAAFEQFCADNNVIDVTGTARPEDDFDARLQRESDARLS